jgi:hypothetical protein
MNNVLRIYGQTPRATRRTLNRAAAPTSGAI